MRLLERRSNGDLTLTEDFADDDVPRYAILSHTWGARDDEVSFDDFMEGTGESKPGYAKIQFCGEQAARDGLQHFWVDTCCINKSNNTELSEAINSMFRWYQNATKCYAYLADVPGPGSDASDQQSWELPFRNCRWFTRGWALQELLAPPSVELFSNDGMKLGSKKSLEREIHEITGIPISALQGSPLSNFSVAERLSWTETRETTKLEDKAYSLLGVFGVHMPLIYGEGRENAFNRLREEIERTLKGRKFKDFSITFSLSDITETEHFVAREQELAEIHAILSGDGSRRIAILHGLGGMGKTQLTVAYAKRHRDSYSAIFWLNIRDKDSLKQSFAKVARRIRREYPTSRLAGLNIEKDLDGAVDAVNIWLSLPENTRWLVIYDNYDNPKFQGNADPTALDIRNYLPESYQGSIIITTRSSQVKIGRRVWVRKLEDVRDSLEILLNTSRREDFMNNPDAISLAKELDGLPLALATAGAYLDQVAIGMSDYLRLYKTSWRKLQETSPELSSYEDRTLYSTWELSFDHVKQQNELSAKLLQFWAYFSSRDIWFELLRHTSPEDPEWIRELTEDEISFNRAVRVLCDHGLVEAEAGTSSQHWIESKGYSMHDCVHSWTIDVLNQEWDFDLARLAVKCVGSHIPSREVNKWWLIQRRLLPHVERCSYIVLNDKIVDDGMEWMFHKLGNLYVDQGKLKEAQKMYQEALQGKEKALGPDHVSTLDTVNSLGNLFRRHGKLKKAKVMYERALQGREKACGPDHISTLDTINFLGNLYMDQGNLTEAEKMYRRALQGYIKTCGPDHTSTVMTINNLGVLYAEQDKLEEAGEMFQQAMQGKEKAWGADHTSTLDTVNNLGNLYTNQGKLTEAEKLYRRVLQGREKSWGVNHVLTLDTLNNLGNLFIDQGKMMEAEQTYKKVLEGYKKIWGSDHIYTLMTVSNLGSLYVEDGKREEAQKTYQQVLDGYEAVLGLDQLNHYRPALLTMENYGFLLADMGSLDQAKDFLTRALSGLSEITGPSGQRCQRIAARLNALGESVASEGQAGSNERRKASKIFKTTQSQR